MMPKWITALSIGAIIIVLSGCDGGGSDTTTLPPTVDEGAATTLGVQAVDASTGEPIDNVTFTVTEGGSAFAATTATEEVGVATFAVNDANDPTVTAVNASVRVAADGYLDSSKSIVIEETGAVDLEIPMISITGAKPTGTAVATATSISTDGTVVGGIDVTVATTASNAAGSEQESARIVVDPSVTMTDAGGNVVTGTLTTEVAYYDANSSDALEAFPGGFAITLANPDDVNVGNSSSIENGEVTFLSAGFTAIEISNESGTKVKSFSNPVPITFTISEDTVDPDTGAPVQVGALLPIWSFDVDAGKWSFEGSGTVSDPTASDGLLQVTYQASHLSYWNLDWYRAGDSGRCFRTDINILSSDGGIYARYARMRISRSGYSKTRRYRGDGILTLYRSPRNVPTTITFIDPATGSELASVDVADLCSLTDITLTPLDESTRVYADVTIKTVTYCSNDDAQPEEPIPSSYVRLFQTSPRFQYIGRRYTDSAGEATYNNLLVSTGASSPEYRVYVRNRIDNQWSVYQNQTFSETNNTLLVRIPQTCETTTGSSGDGSGTGS